MGLVGMTSYWSLGHLRGTGVIMECLRLCNSKMIPRLGANLPIYDHPTNNQNWFIVITYITYWFAWTVLLTEQFDHFEGRGVLNEKLLGAMASIINVWLVRELSSTCESHTTIGAADHNYTSSAPKKLFPPVKWPSRDLTQKGCCSDGH